MVALILPEQAYGVKESEKASMDLFRSDCDFNAPAYWGVVRAIWSNRHRNSE